MAAPLNEELVAAAFSAMLQRPVVTQQEYEKRRHEPEFSTVEELNYERLSETVYTPAAGSSYREIGGQKEYAVFGHCVIQCP